MQVIRQFGQCSRKKIAERPSQEPISSTLRTSAGGINFAQVCRFLVVQSTVKDLPAYQRSNSFTDVIPDKDVVNLTAFSLAVILRRSGRLASRGDGHGLAVIAPGIRWRHDRLRDSLAHARPYRLGVPALCLAHDCAHACGASAARSTIPASCSAATSRCMSRASPAISPTSSSCRRCSMRWWCC